MKKTIALAFLFVSTVAFSQLTTIPNESSKFKPVEFIRTPDGGYLSLETLRLDKANFNINAFRVSLTIVKYDKDMNFVKRQLVSGNEKGFAYYYSSIKQSGEKFWLVCLEVLKDSKKAAFNNIVAYEIDPLTLQTSNSKIIAEGNNINQEVDGYYEPGFKLIFETSQDKKHHAVFIYNSGKEFYLSALNESFEPIWNTRQSIPEFKMKPEYFRSIHVDNDGYVFMIAASFKEGGYIASFSSSNGSATYKNCTAGSEIINDAILFTDPLTGNLLLAGTSKKDYENNVTSVFKAAINKKALTLAKVKVTDIPAEVMTVLSDHDYAGVKSKNYGLYHYRFRSKVVTQNQGNIYLILECKDHIENPGYSSMRNAGEIVPIIITSDIPVFSYVRRYAVMTFNNENGQYFPYACKHKLALIYFDNSENINKAASEKPLALKWDKDAMLVAAFVTTDGTVSKKQVPVSSLGIWQSVNNFLKQECDEK